MPNVDKYFDDIDAARIRRVKELSEVKRSFAALASSDTYGIASKAVVVLAYANWEGFYNECVRAYLDFLSEKGGKVCETDWKLLVSALQSDFDSLRDRNHSLKSRQDFVERLKTKLNCSFDAVDVTFVSARSNLDFERLTQNYELLDFDLSTMRRWKHRLDKELVGWRHAVAHGDSPDLRTMDVAAHIDFAAQLLILIADRFESAIVDRI